MALDLPALELLAGRGGGVLVEAGEARPIELLARVVNWLGGGLPAIEHSAGAIEGALKLAPGFDSFVGS